MRIVIAGGGTGGHLFPGIAIAEEFLRRDDKTRIIFIGTKKGIESKLLGQLGYELREIDIEGVSGRGVRHCKGSLSDSAKHVAIRAYFEAVSPSHCYWCGRLRFRTGSAYSTFYANTYRNRGTKCYSGYY